MVTSLMKMKSLLLVALSLFVGSVAAVLVSPQNFCRTRWVAFLFALLSAAGLLKCVRSKGMGTSGAGAVVAFAFTIVFDCVFMFLATRRC
jgi:hypothetical protein